MIFLYFNCNVVLSVVLLSTSSSVQGHSTLFYSGSLFVILHVCSAISNFLYVHWKPTCRNVTVTGHQSALSTLHLYFDNTRWHFPIQPAVTAAFAILDIFHMPGCHNLIVSLEEAFVISPVLKVIIQKKISNKGSVSLGVPGGRSCQRRQFNFFFQLSQSFLFSLATRTLLTSRK